MSQRWLTADTHFLHRTARSYYHRPFRTVKEMDEAMVDRWNGSVRPGDTVYHLGDFYWTRGVDQDDVEGILKSLHGKIILVRGNHDPKPSEVVLVENVVSKLVVSGITLVHDPDDVAKKVWAFCGHVHRKWLYRDNKVNVGVDLWDYRPVAWETAADLLKGVAR